MDWEGRDVDQGSDWPDNSVVFLSTSSPVVGQYLDRALPNCYQTPIHHLQSIIITLRSVASKRQCKVTVLGREA
jgi:hypothetical protein